jgi:hypothetical protein
MVKKYQRNQKNELMNVYKFHLKQKRGYIHI